MAASIQRICVFCGSSSGSRPEYLEAALSLGNELAARKIGLVYGGASIGLMGAVADAIVKSGGEAIGVIPQVLMKREVAHTHLTELFVVEDMHQRKAKMAGLASAFVTMPGGFGTFEELFEVITWSQLGIHRKPIGLLNVSGYFDPLLSMISHAVNEGFVQKQHESIFVSEPTAPRVLDALDALSTRLAE